MVFIKFISNLKYFYFLLFLNIIIGCSHTIMKTEMSQIQQKVDEFNANDHSSTGTSFTMQCPKYNNGNEITFNSGLQSINGIKTKNNSLYRVGSNTKLFIAVIILQLESEGKISINDSLFKYFSIEYPKWSEVKISQLLNMTSGINNYLGKDINPIPPKFLSEPSYHYTKEELLNLVVQDNLNFRPGERWEYSNTNYILLGKIIENVTKNSLSEELKNRILIPLSLHQTFFVEHLPNNEIPNYELENLMTGYFYGYSILSPNGFDVKDFSLSQASSAGGMIANTRNLNKFLRTLFTNKKLLLNDNQFNKLISRVDINNRVNDYYGFAIFDVYNFKFKTSEYMHTGGVFGFSSKMSYLPEQNVSYAYAINSDNKEKVNEFNELIESIIYNECL
jgi:D-alanyl-D-alanine carboxypeptidase